VNLNAPHPSPLRASGEREPARKLGLAALEAHDDFLARHVGTTPAAQAAMLRDIG